MGHSIQAIVIPKGVEISSLDNTKRMITRKHPPTKHKSLRRHLQTPTPSNRQAPNPSTCHNHQLSHHHRPQQTQTRTQPHKTTQSNTNCIRHYGSLTIDHQSKNAYNEHTTQECLFDTPHIQYNASVTCYCLHKKTHP